MSKKKNAKSYKCWVPGCGFDEPTGSYKLPDEEKDSARRQIWIDLLHLDSAKINTLTRVCNAHFDPADILPRNLKKGTNPSRNLPVGYSLSFQLSFSLLN